MSQLIEELKNYLDKVYRENIHVACLELPILKILSENNDWSNRENILEKLENFGKFKRGELSFDHLWSQRFGKGEESELLNSVVEHDGENAGDKKNKYRIKEEVKQEITSFIKEYKADIEDLISKRKNFVNKKHNSLEKNFSNWLTNTKKLANSTILKYINRLKKSIPEKMIEMKLSDNAVSIFDLDYEEIDSIYDMLKTGGQLYDWNISTLVKSEASAAIKNFLEFLQNNNNAIINGETKMPNNTKQPLNQILYGPPGTGKTYNTINKALEIIFENEKKGQTFTIYEIKEKDGYDIAYQEALDKNDREAIKAIFDEYIKAGQIEFVTFHQSYGYEEFVEGIKADVNEKDDVIYKKEDGIFRKLSKLAETNYKKSLSTVKTKKDFEIIFKEKILDKLVDDEKLKIETSKKYFYITEVTERTIFFEKADGQTDHSLSIKTLKEMYEKGKNEKIKGGLAVYYEPLLKLLLKDSLFDKKDNEPLKNYILIIDEINRGNISKILGELITLIEPSKRIGADEEIRVKLPYSGDDFGVPSNLYIIGTMNTADRSIALMDTALRRRFDFEEMMPNLAVLSNNNELVQEFNSSTKQDNDLIIDNDLNIRLLLKTLNQRVEYLYDRDHTIGHAYFMSLKDEKITDKKAELDNIFRNKIIPLLQEYFYDDWEKIQMVLGDHYDQIKGNKNSTGTDSSSFDDEVNKNRFIQSIKVSETDIIGFNHEDIEDEGKDYRINPNKDGFPVEAYLKLCQNK